MRLHLPVSGCNQVHCYNMTSMSTSASSSSSSSSLVNPHTSLLPYLKHPDFSQKALTIVIVGGSGHLARTQVIPAIFSLFCKQLLPKNFHLIGYARSHLTEKQFRSDKVEEHLAGYESHEKHNMRLQQDQAKEEEQKERNTMSKLFSFLGKSSSTSTGTNKDNESGGERISDSAYSLRKSFLSRCSYVQGQYDQPQDFQKLVQHMEQVERENKEAGEEKKNADKTSSTPQQHQQQEQQQQQQQEQQGANRIYYLAIPPDTFASALRCIHSIRSSAGWTRVVIEKPFGEDLTSAKQLNQEAATLFHDEEIYRIDHFMGKESLQNLIPLRFSNVLLHECWNATYVDHIVITFKEQFGLEGRAGYFDKSGIIRDMIQNHLLLMLALLTMEQPVSNAETALHEAKYKAFCAMKPITEDDVVIGQYGASADGKKKAYADEEDVEQPSKTLTYVCLVVHMDNDRWRGVPLVINCGKALNETKTCLRVQFKPRNSALFPASPANMLLITISPEASLTLHLNTKSPGIDDQPVKTQMELVKEGQTRLAAVPASYERLIFDVIRGNHTLFVSAKEVEAAWAVVDPLLKKLEGEPNKGKQPEIYPFGSHGPKKADELLNKYKIGVQLEQL